jgi:hypothetical protein
MPENMQADVPQSRQAVFVRCCLDALVILHLIFPPFSHILYQGNKSFVLYQ